MEVVAILGGLILNIAILALVVWAIVAVVRSVRRGSTADPYAGAHWYMRPALSAGDALSQLLATLAVALLAIGLQLAARQFGLAFFSGTTAVFAAAVLAYALAYWLRGPLLLLFALAATYLWTGLWLARWAPTDPAKVVAVVAGLGLLSLSSWALGRIHETSERTRRFGFVYRLVGIFGVTGILFWVSSQWGISMMGATPWKVLTSSWRLPLGLGTLLAVTVGLLVWWAVRCRSAWPEIAGLTVLAAAFALFAALPPSVSSGSWDPFSSQSFKLSSGGMAWSIAFNVLLLGELLGLVALGYARREDWMVNLSAVLLFLFVLVKYFDWLFTFLDRSLAFIVSGLLLVGVGLAMERGRRAVIKAMEAEDAKA